jgi:integrase
MAEGVGFEPTVGLRLRLISSQVPLTTQPPFQSFTTNHLRTNRSGSVDNWILQLYTCCVKERQQEQMAAKSPWQKTNFANLIRYVPSGVYFARLRVGGKLIRQSLKTQVLSVAKLKLADLEKEERSKVERSARLVGAKLTFQDLLTEYLAKLDANPAIKPRTKTYRRECITRLKKTWPGLMDTDARKISKDDCERWAGRFATQSSPTAFNNTVGTLRMILDIAVENGARYTNPAKGVKRVRVRAKELRLPSQEEFLKLVEEIRRVPFGPGLASADLAEFLAYGGFRKGEAKFMTWADCDFERGEVIVRGHPETGTKGGEIRRVPMIPDMRVLLERLKQDRSDETPDKPVMRVSECQGALTRACRVLGIARITHHDLRHLFATRCIESGVDIPTVSRWLGHKDGGALAMRVYGHLRDQHSTEMAQKVTFSATPPAQAPKG